MDHFENKEVIQAVLIADNNMENFRPFSDESSTALLPVVNVPIIDYALESLNRCGVEEVFVFSSLFINKLRDHIKARIAEHCSWSVNMKVNIIGGEGCRCFGDALRDLDAKALIRGNFILLGADTVTNANLKTIFDQHKKTAKRDKGTAMTVIFKESSARLPTGNEVIIAMDIENNRLHYHKRISQYEKAQNFEIPLEIFLLNSQVTVHHNLMDPQMAICSPSLLSLFSDNFDFGSRDDFIRGLLINEEILDSRIYVSMLPNEQYACKVSNWITYQTVSNEIINRWVYPLVPDQGICCLWQNYVFSRNNIYKSPDAKISRKVILKENVVIAENSCIENGAKICSSVIGKNCTIGENCVLKNAYLMDGVTVGNDCLLEYCIIGSNAIIGANCFLKDGVVVKSKDVIKDGQKRIGNEEFLDDEGLTVPAMQFLPNAYDDSDYHSSSDEEESILQGSPIPDDANIFLSEVIDSLNRGYQEKSNPDFLILEINSSRYAYNMSLKEVNFNVVKAVFNLPKIKESNSDKILSSVNEVFNVLGAVVANYIKTDEAMSDCLEAIEEYYLENENIKSKVVKVIHYLYDKEYISEDAILAWHDELDETSPIKKILKQLIDWLNQSSEEDDSEEE